MKIVIITGNNYPCGDAGAVRQHAMAKLLMDMGHDVFVIGYGPYTGNKEKVYDSVPYISFRKKSNNRIIRAFYRVNFGSRVATYIKKHHQDFNCLLVVDILPNAFKTIEKLAQERNALLIHDSVEWYSPEEFENREKNRAYKNKEYTNLIAINEKWRVIAISKYLENHFSSRCSKVVRIPVIMDVNNMKSIVTHNNKKKQFVYAGAPSRKDYLREMIYGFRQLSSDERNGVEFHVIGVNENQLISICGVEKSCIDDLEGTLFVHGRVSRDEALKWVQNADFTMLIRDESLRYAKAGFPTKIVESLSSGTPVVCNISSDLGEYLEDGKNAFIINGHSVESIAATIRKIIPLKTDSLDIMRKEARKTAEKYFDYRQYYREMSYILK